MVAHRSGTKRTGGWLFWFFLFLFLFLCFFFLILVVLVPPPPRPQSMCVSTIQPTAQVDLNLRNDCTAYLIKLLLFSFIHTHSSNSVLKSQNMIIKKGPVHSFYKKVQTLYLI